MTAVPFALVAVLILVWAVCLLVGTLGSLDVPDDTEDGTPRHR